MQIASSEDGARALIVFCDTPILTDLVDLEGQINWDLVFERYKYLSHGEQAMIELAASITGRPAPGDHGFRSLWELVGAVSEDHRALMTMVLAAFTAL